MPTTGSFSPSTVELGATTLAALETITVLQGTTPWVIGDGGGSITIDGTVSISGTVTVDTELPTATILVDDDPNPTTSRIGANNLIWDGATWDRMREPTADALAVTGLAAAANQVFNGATWDRMRSGTATGSVLVNNPTAANFNVTVGNGAGAAAVNIQDGGNSITVDGAVTVSGTITTQYQYAEDSIHGTTNIGAFTLGVRNDAAAALTDANGDYSPFAVDSAGRIGISDLGGSISIDDNGGSITVDGTVTVTQGTSPWVTSLDAASLAALESITVQNGAGAAAVNIQDGGNSITVDGTVSITAGTGRDDTDNQAAVATGLNTNVVRTYIWDAAGTNWDRWTGAITDGGGSITVDGTVTVTQGTSPWVTSLDAASLAALESITVQNGGGVGAVNIQDGGNSITVDGTVGISGTVTVTTAYQYNEDSTHADTSIGAFILAVRNDAGTPLAGNGDYIPFTVDANGDLYVTTGRNGSLANGAETAVTNVAAQILAANTARKKYIVQNTGAANIRVGITGVTATTGFRLVAGGSMVIEMPNCPTNAIFAIREGATNSIAFAQEIT